MRCTVCVAQVAIKPQLDTDFVKHLAGKKVGEVLKQVDERNLVEEMAEKLELTNLLERDVKQLSGGELQRMAIAACALRDADIYMFDEASSFLDVRQVRVYVYVVRLQVVSS